MTTDVTLAETPVTGKVTVSEGEARSTTEAGTDKTPVLPEVRVMVVAATMSSLIVRVKMAVLLTSRLEEVGARVRVGLTTRMDTELEVQLTDGLQEEPRLKTLAV